MQLLITGLIMGAIGLMALLIIVGCMGCKIARSEFWQGMAFLASAAGILLGFGLLMAGHGLYEMGRDHPSQPSVIGVSMESALRAKI